MNRLQPDLVEKWCFIWDYSLFRFDYNIDAFYYLGTTLFELGTSASVVQTPNFGYSFNLEPQFVRMFHFFFSMSTISTSFNP